MLKRSAIAGVENDRMQPHLCVAVMLFKDINSSQGPNKICHILLAIARNAITSTASRCARRTLLGTFLIETYKG
jgi:hypothetical protein